jgi:phage terminase small subunit
MSGRRPNSSTINKLHGTKDAVNQDQPVVPEGAPDKPEGLPAVASAEWDFLVGELTDSGTISQVDRAVIEMAARYAGHYHEARVDVEKGGLTVATKQGV